MSQTSYDPHPKGVCWWRVCGPTYRSHPSPLRGQSKHCHVQPILGPSSLKQHIVSHLSSNCTWWWCTCIVFFHYITIPSHIVFTFSVNSRFLALCSNHLANIFSCEKTKNLLQLKITTSRHMLSADFGFYLSWWIYSPHKWNKNSLEPRTEVFRWKVLWNGTEHSFKLALIKLCCDLALGGDNNDQ